MTALTVDAYDTCEEDVLPGSMLGPDADLGRVEVTVEK